MSTVAIVGNAPTKDNAPFKDKSIKIWGLNQHGLTLPRVDRVFELHSREVLEAREGRLEPLRNSTVPIFMQEKHSDIPKSEKFPIERVIEKHGKVFASTIDYMLAFVVDQKASRVELYGIDMAIYSEYAYQRPSCFYWLGYLKGLGIEVFVDPNSRMHMEHYYAYSSNDDIAELIEEFHHVKKQLEAVDMTKAYLEGIRDTFLRTGTDLPLDVTNSFAELRSKAAGLEGQLSKVRNRLFKEHGIDPRALS